MMTVTPPAVVVALELRVVPALAGRRVVVASLPQVEPRAVRSVLPDAVRPAPEPAHAARLLLGRVELHAEQVDRPVESVLVVEPRGPVGRDAPARPFEGAVVMRLDDEVAAFHVRLEEHLFVRAGDVHVPASVSAEGDEARAVAERDQLAAAADFGEQARPFVE